MEIFGLDILSFILALVGAFAILGYIFYWVAKISCYREKEHIPAVEDNENNGINSQFYTKIGEEWVKIEELERIGKKAEFFDKFIARAYIDLNEHKDTLVSNHGITVEQYDAEMDKICAYVKWRNVNPDTELLRWAFNSIMKDNGYIYVNKPYDSRDCAKCYDNLARFKNEANTAIEKLEFYSSKPCEHFFERKAQDISDVVLECKSMEDGMFLPDVLEKSGLSSCFVDAVNLIRHGFVTINWLEVDVDFTLGNVVFPKIKADGLTNIIQVCTYKDGIGHRKSVRVIVNPCKDVAEDGN